MTVRPVVTENSSHFVTVAFYDEDGVAVLPDTVTVRLDAPLAGAAAEIRAATPVAPLAEFDLHLTPAENALADPTLDREERVLTVHATYGMTKAVTAEYSYTLKNLRFVPVG